jgi:Flp pilus assembly protein TadG
MRPPVSRHGERGNNILEFALVIFPLVLLLLGVANVGIELGTSVRVVQVTRDAASMYVRGVDFSNTASQDLLMRLAQGLGVNRTGGGRGVFIFSRVTYVPAAQCAELNLSPCNANSHVVTQRIVVGNAGLRASALGTPNPALLDSKGLVRDYLKESSAVASFPWIQLERNEYSYVVETFFEGQFYGSRGNYTRAIF